MLGTILRPGYWPNIIITTSSPLVGHGRKACFDTNRRMWRETSHRFTHQQWTAPSAPSCGMAGTGNRLRSHQCLQNSAQREHRHRASLPYFGGTRSRFLRWLPECLRILPRRLKRGVARPESKEQPDGNGSRICGRNFQTSLCLTSVMKGEKGWAPTCPAFLIGEDW